MYDVQEMVSMAAESQLIEKPQTLLSIRQGQCTLSRDGAQRVGLENRRGAESCLDVLGHLRHCRLSEETGKRQLDMGSIVDVSKQLRGQERVPPQLEEVIMATHTIKLEHSAPESCQYFLEGRARECEIGAYCGQYLLRGCQAQFLRQPTALQFTHGSFREFFHNAHLAWYLKSSQVPGCELYKVVLSHCGAWA